MKRSRTTGSLTLLVVIALLTSACASYRVQTDYDPETDFDPYQSYVWMERPATEDPRVYSDLMQRRVRGAVDSVLAERGLVLREEGEADLLVVYHAAVERRLDIDTVSRRYGYRRSRYGYGETTTVREYDVGVLVIDLVDARTRALVWRGTGQARLQDRATPERRDARVRAVVEAILADFPPGGLR